MTGGARLSSTTAEAIADHAAALADRWPPLTDDQLTRVAFLLRNTESGEDSAA